MSRVAVVGGGMAGLAAAWRLSRPDGPGHEVTVYQRGGRLGGKGASSRGEDGRILEHGFHVWLGYYDNAFRLLREVYEELDRPRTRPGCPITCVEDAFRATNTIGLRVGSEPWVATFPENDLVPGTGDGAAGLSVGELVTRAGALLASFGASLAPARSQAVLSTKPRPPRRLGGLASMEPLRRTAAFVELITVMLRGVAADELHARGYASIDDLDFRQWLAMHGASDAVLESPLVRGVYDLVFGYEDGDRDRPRFAAGAGVHLSARMFLTYRGAIFWTMTAGMGDVVFAPLYEALRTRGVRFEFFHRLDDVHLSADGRSVSALTFGRQAEAGESFEPLVEVNGLPVFPEAADDYESAFCSTPDVGSVRLEAGRDYDSVVLAVSVGMVPYVCSEILAKDQRWRDLVTHVRTVATQAGQVWLAPSEGELGGSHPGAVLTCWGEPFDTVASLSHTVSREAWSDRPPRTSVSLCAVMGDGEVDVAANVARFLDSEGPRIWPRLAPDHVVATYARANVDPSDRYVQSIPGSGQYRLRADGSGYANLVLAGDWLDTGLNAGCIEAATLGGLQAANAVEGRPIAAGTVGFAPHRRQAIDGDETR